jgi:hypothetical protein
MVEQKTFLSEKRPESLNPHGVNGNVAQPLVKFFNPENKGRECLFNSPKVVKI